jgi:hypothetical protein
VLTVPLLIEKIYKKQIQPLIETPKMQRMIEDTTAEQAGLQKDQTKTDHRFWR